MVQHRMGKADAARDWDVKQAKDREAWMIHLLRREAETVLASRP
jgi:hypothetical protein